MQCLLRGRRGWIKKDEFNLNNGKTGWNGCLNPFTDQTKDPKRHTHHKLWAGSMRRWPASPMPQGKDGLCVSDNHNAASWYWRFHASSQSDSTNTTPAWWKVLEAVTGDSLDLQPLSHPEVLLDLPLLCARSSLSRFLPGSLSRNQQRRGFPFLTADIPEPLTDVLLLICVRQPTSGTHPL